MAVSRAKRASNNKWDKENMKIVACKIKKEDAEAFKRYAEDNNTTSNALLRNFVYKCINKAETESETTPE
jgi:hypothetical protein